MPVYFIRSEHISNNKVEVEGELAHHLRDVLRLKIGESLTLVDEYPHRYHTRVISAQPGPLILEVERREGPAAKQDPTLRLGIAILKGEKMDWVVQKATEIGVARLSPLLTERTIVQARADRVARQVERWKKIALEAAQQSCRWAPPQIDPPLSLTDFLAEKAFPGPKLIFSPASSAEDLRKTIRSSAPAVPAAGCILIGPEGGFTAAELDTALQAGFQAASLGENVLRAETAALAALAILQYEMRAIRDARWTSTPPR